MHSKSLVIVAAFTAWLGLAAAANAQSQIQSISNKTKGAGSVDATITDGNYGTLVSYPTQPPGNVSSGGDTTLTLKERKSIIKVVRNEFVISPNSQTQPLPGGESRISQRFRALSRGNRCEVRSEIIAEADIAKRSVSGGPKSDIAALNATADLEAVNVQSVNNPDDKDFSGTYEATFDLGLPIDGNISADLEITSLHNLTAGTTMHIKGPGYNELTAKLDDQGTWDVRGWVVDANGQAKQVNMLNLKPGPGEKVQKIMHFDKASAGAQWTLSTSLKENVMDSMITSKTAGGYGKVKDNLRAVIKLKAFTFK